MHQPFYLVAGLGKTGHSIAGYLTNRNISFALFDTRDEALQLAEFKRDFPKADVFLQDIPKDIYSSLTGIIASPGVPLDHPVFLEALRLGIPLKGDIECLAQDIKAPIIAITGTNGKSTVTSLVGEMAKAAGLKVAVAGNIGSAVLDLIDDGESYDLWVLELSSFQLDLTYSLAPIAATILNISPDHLDRHHTFSAYIAAKQRVYRQAKQLVYNRDDQLTFPQETQSEIKSYGLTKPDEGLWGIITIANKSYLAYGSECIFPCDSLILKGKHNWQNALAACALAFAANIPLKAIISTLTSFAGLPHRCQWVRTINAVDWINDSKGTNIGASISAIQGIGSAINGKIVLIAGGLGKGADFKTLRASIFEFVRSVVLIGADAKIIAQALVHTVPLIAASSLQEAILLAKAQALPEDVVLLSPACASQDMFRDFNHRGEVFRNLVELL